MAQQRQKKRKRSRHDPARKEAARRREEARRQAAEERRRQQAAEERRNKLRRRLRRLALPTLATIGLFVVALYLFRPPPELEGVVKFTGPDVLMSRLGYEGDWNSIGADLIPDPQCGITDQELPDIEAYAAIYNGFVTLWYQPGGEIGASEIWDAVSSIYDHNLVVAPNTAITTPVAAASWRRLGEYQNTDDLAAFVETYLQHKSPGTDRCLGEFAEVDSVLATLGYEGDWASIDPAALPDPACGRLDAPISGAEAYSALYNGAVVLWHRSDDESTAGHLVEAASSYDSQVLVVPDDTMAGPILAAAWDRLMVLETTDRIAAFIDAFRGRGPGNAECPTNFTGQGG